MVDPLQFQTMVELSFGDRAPRCGGCGVDDPDQPDQASPSELDLIKHADQCADRPKMSVEAQRCGVHPFAPSPHIFVTLSITPDAADIGTPRTFLSVSSRSAVNILAENCEERTWWANHDAATPRWPPSSPGPVGVEKPETPRAVNHFWFTARGDWYRRLTTQRQSTARPRRPPAVPPRNRCSSCASYRPSASPGACVYGRCHRRNTWTARPYVAHGCSHAR